MQVLLIEDDALLRMTLSDTLSEAGIEVNGLANAEDALILLGAGQVPDVLVTDISLGEGLSGFDLADVARARHPEVGVILISGTVAETEQHPLRRHGGSWRSRLPRMPWPKPSARQLPGAVTNGASAAGPSAAVERLQVGALGRSCCLPDVPRDAPYSALSPRR